MSGDEKIERVYVHFLKALAIRDIFCDQAFRCHHHGRGQHLDICSLANGFMKQSCLGFKIGQRWPSEWELKSDHAGQKQVMTNQVRKAHWFLLVFPGSRRGSKEIFERNSFFKEGVYSLPVALLWPPPRGDQAGLPTAPSRHPFLTGSSASINPDTNSSAARKENNCNSW